MSILSRWSWVPVLALALLLVMPCPSLGQTAQGRIHGQVKDQSSGKPVSNVLVSLVGTEIRAETSDRGRFVLTDVPPGTYELRAQRIGFSPNGGQVTIAAGTQLEVDINIAAKPVELDPLLVITRSGKLTEVGFYDRRHNGGLSGRYITSADIERRGAARMTDMLVDVASVKVLPVEPGRVTVRFNRHVPESASSRKPRQLAFDGPRNPLDARGCEPDLYIDGRLYRNSSPPMTSSGSGAALGTPLSNVDDFNAVPVPEIDGIEIYVGPALPPFVRMTACGVILVWTKR